MQMQDIKGLEHAKRAVEVAIAGGHTLLITGETASGKTSLLAAAATLATAADCRIQTADGVRAFLRLTEGQLNYNPVLAAIAPCNCGNYGSETKPCRCGLAKLAAWQTAIDTNAGRFAMHTIIYPAPVAKLSTKMAGEPSATIAERIKQARLHQWERGTINGMLSLTDIQTHCTLDAVGENLLRAAMNQLHMDPRQYLHTLRIARTIADLGGYKHIQVEHVAEALNYQRKPTYYQDALHDAEPTETTPAEQMLDKIAAKLRKMAAAAGYSATEYGTLDQLIDILDSADLAPQIGYLPEQIAWRDTATEQELNRQVRDTIATILPISNTGMDLLDTEIRIAVKKLATNLIATYRMDLIANAEPFVMPF